MTATALDNRLRCYSPVGLRLRTLFHGRVAEDPRAAVPRETELIDTDGLGEAHVWAGLVNSVPFVLRTMPRPTGWGFDVSLPVRIDGAHADIALLTALPLFVARAEHPYFESLPFQGGGFAVLGIGETDPIFKAKARTDAEAIAAFVTAAGPSRYVIAPVDEERGWIVAGPKAGPYISRLEVTSTEDAARKQAARWAGELGQNVTVSRALPT